ncbi:DUF4019 domain-containing protein [Solimonas sp. K1W22B-7]|uniref:DUF4019 domain-containing protein n=1 Tax=Solimonas sp. K1W22B-7 TaxID=2303331 RepID=UPI0013C43934|nr:DUF4019 domain-containing protein [Solimonas sp. K1W22B-7]
MSKAVNAVRRRRDVRGAFIAAMVALAWSVASVAQPMQDRVADPREPEAIATATAWLDLLAAGKAQESYAQFTDLFKQQVTPDAWRTDLETSTKALGKLRSRKLRRVVVYKDPPNAPLPGTYMAVEYDSVYERAPAHFQFVVLHSAQGEPFRVMRHESTMQLGTAAKKPEPVAETQGSSIGYKTVQEALAALKAKAGAKVSEQQGWTIVQDQDAGNIALWSFTPQGHPAYPSAVKRSVVERDGALHIDMKVQCQAGKEPCDQLVRDFMALNERMKEDLEKRRGQSKAQ